MSVAAAKPVVAHHAGRGRRGVAIYRTGNLARNLPPEEQSIVQAIFLLGIVIAPTIGPTLDRRRADDSAPAFAEKRSRARPRRALMRGNRVR